MNTLTAAEGWTIADGVGTYPVKLDSIDCQKRPTAGLPNTGVNLPPLVWWGAGASLLLGVALALASRVRARR